MFKVKLKAFFVHFLLSAIALSFILAVIALYWFPSPFMGISNFKEIALLLITVDLILGPLLTFVAYNPSKKSLKLDLSAIVFVQIIALSYGLYSLYLSHPLYITYFDNAFNLVSTNAAKPETAVDERFKVSKLSSPIVVFSDVDDKKKDQLFSELLKGGADLEARAEYYEPIEDHLNEIIKNGLNPAITFKNKESKLILDQFISQNGKTVDDYIFVPLIGDGKKVIWVLQKETGKPVDTIDLSSVMTALK